MLAAFTHQIKELEKKTEIQRLQILKLKHIIDTNQQKSVCDCKAILDNLQSQVTNNCLKIGELSTKFDYLQVSYDAVATADDPFCEEMTDTSPFIEDSSNDGPNISAPWKAPGSRGPTPNNLPDGYESPPLVGSPVHAYSAKEFFAAASFANTSNMNVNMCSSANQVSAAGFCVGKQNPWSFDNPKIKEPPKQQNSSQEHNGFQFGDRQQQNETSSNSNKNQSSAFTLENITSIATENSHLKQQILKYRQKAAEFEDKLKIRESSIGDLRMIREHYIQKEREWNQKQEWYEHKLKLLKQDKRRRGETIGKLLKCIDDMKDNGRLDESRVKEGRSVLSATLSSRGMHPEERVVRVVEAVEFDRVPRTPECPDFSGENLAPENKFLANACSRNENKNNSSYGTRPSYDELSKDMDKQAEFLAGKRERATAEFLAEKYGFVPINNRADCDVEMQ